MDLDNYCVNTIHPILEPIVTRMVQKKPDNPAQFISNYLAVEHRIIPQVSAEEISRLKQEIERLKSKLSDAERGASDASTRREGDPDDTVTEDDDDDDEDEEDDIGELPCLPKALARPRHSVSAEAYGEWNQKKDFEPPKVPKTDEQMQAIRAVLSESFLFSSLDEKDLTTVIEAMQLKICEDTDRVIQQGDEGDHLYIVQEGQCKCFKKFPGDEDEKEVATCGVGDAFGELALLYNCPRAASVQANGKATLWALDRETFNHIVKDAAARKRNLHEDFLAKVPLLSGLDAYERAKIADCVKSEKFEDGQYIVKQGEAGDRFYFIESGAACATKSLVTGQGPQQVMSYDAGDYFGELALLKNEPRAANVVAKGTVSVVSIDRKSFKRLLGPLEDILRRNTSRYE